VGTINTKETTKDELVKMMVGRVIYNEQKEKSLVPCDAPVTLEVKNLSSGNTLKNVSFNLKKVP